MKTEGVTKYFFATNIFSTTTCSVKASPHSAMLSPGGGKGNNVVEVADIPAAGICTAQRKKPHNCNAGNGHLDTLTFPSEGSGHL